MPADRLRVLWDCAALSSRLPGDVAELGVYRGGSAMLLAAACPGKAVFALDTFSGLPNVGEHDVLRGERTLFGHRNGDFAVPDVDEVVDRLQRTGVMVCSGFFPASTADLQGRVFCLTHCDADTFNSTRSFIDFFYPRVVPGGCMVFDDYGWSATPGVKKAVDEFLVGRPELPEVRTPFQCVLTKLGP